MPQQEGRTIFNIAWQQIPRRIILASRSPRRKELLEMMGLKFETIPAEPIDENEYIDTADIAGSLERLAIVKAMSVACKYPEAAVLAADTVVVCGKEILGKPKDRLDARRMLESLAGRCHKVITGVALLCKETDFCRTFARETNVWFREITTEEIEWYIDSGEPFDKAGAYGIQGKAMIFVDKIEGCFYNIVGLPVGGTIDLIKYFIARKEVRNVSNE